MNKRDPERSQKQIQAMCFSKWRQSKGESLNSVKYMMPIRLKESSDDSALIGGTAIAAATSRNNVKYTIKGLQDNKTLEGMNISVGHEDNPANNVGVIDEVNWDKNSKEMKYKGRIYNTARFPDAVHMVKKGLWQHVSIEAIPLDAQMSEDDDNTFIVNDLDFTGLAFVKSPGIRQASAALAGESLGFQLSEALQNRLKEENKMSEKEEVKEEKDIDSLVSEKVKQILQEKEKKEKLEEEAKEKKKLQEKVEELEKRLEEAEKEEEAEESEESEGKGVVGEEQEEEAETNLIFENTEGHPGCHDFFVMPGVHGELKEAV